MTVETLWETLSQFACKEEGASDEELSQLRELWDVWNDLNQLVSTVRGEGAELGKGSHMLLSHITRLTKSIQFFMELRVPARTLQEKTMFMAGLMTGWYSNERRRAQEMEAK